MIANLFEGFCPLCKKPLKDTRQGCSECGVFYCFHCKRWRGWTKGAGDNYPERCDECWMPIGESKRTELKEYYDWVQDVWDFRIACMIEVNTKPRKIERRYDNQHLKILREDLHSLKEAMEKGDIPGMTNSYVCLVYEVIGSALVHGIDLRTVWGAFHKLRMKAEALNGKSLKGKT